MTKLLDVIKKTRHSLLELINGLDAQQLNLIPDGFNNNIIWNLGHMVSSQQGLCYLKAGLEPVVKEEFRIAYQPGSVPLLPLSITEINNIKNMFILTIEQLETDIDKGLFLNYICWTNRFDIEMTCINDVLCYLPYHDGLHSDRIAAYRRLIL